ncbi:MAG: TonB-dependent receptor [Candidatus Cloacimonetes bacterium]|nr:TonB-dependent receptor [Candidatus Cloacimonadota bacterium]MDD3235526.1 TonB-dependent receptor [Candidatus Cloacimonadota bacterium]
MKLYVLSIIMLMFLPLSAATISGFVSRADSAEPLQYVNVRIAETKVGMQTNKKGYYVLNIVAPGTYTVEFTLISYLTLSHSFSISDVNQNISFDAAMGKNAIELQKVTVTGTNEDEGPTIRSSLIRRNTEQIQSVVSPIEADVFRAVLALPGVAPISDFSSGLYVRGGSPDQNLILLDDIDVYNPNHFGGVFSTFNSDAVESIELIKGGYPAKYGGRLSSVLDVMNRQGNRNYHQGTARLSAISSSATLEGPIHIGNQNGSYMGSLRRTYLEVVKQIYKDLPDYYFYDGHFKVNWDASPRDKVSASAYFGRDKLNFDFGAVLKLDWGNKTFTTQLVHIFNPKLFAQFVFAGSEFTSNFSQIAESGDVAFERRNGIHDLTGKANMSYRPSNNHQLDFGTELKWNRTWLEMDTSQQFDPNSLPDITVGSLTAAAYVQDVWDINPLWTLQPGLRLAMYKTVEKNLAHIPDASYMNLEPRISLRRNLDVGESVYLNFGLYHQYLTLMTMEISTPFDVWFPLDGSLKPGESLHYTLGYKRQLTSNFAFDMEVYYKTYKNLLEYNVATDFSWDNETGTLSDTFHVGKGYTYGTDLMLRTDWNGFEGFIGLTLSKTKRKMEGFNLDPITHQGVAYYPKYDRSHNLSIVETYNLTRATGFQVLGSDFKIGMNFSYNSGQPSSKPERFYYDGESYQLIYSYKDRIRLPEYVRLDLSTKYEWVKSWGSIEPYFEVINVFNRKNVGSRDYSLLPTDSGGLELKANDATQFPLLPFIGVNVKW